MKIVAKICLLFHLGSDLYYILIYICVYIYTTRTHIVKITQKIDSKCLFGSSKIEKKLLRVFRKKHGLVGIFETLVLFANAEKFKELDI